MNFKTWLLEVGGTGGVGGGLTPPLERQTNAGAFADYHGKDQSDPRNPSGVLPPVNVKKKYYIKSKGYVNDKNTSRNRRRF